MGKIVLPYYSREGIRIYCCDCRQVSIQPTNKFLITDPPYGVKTNTKNADRAIVTDQCARKNYASVFGDDKSFDPAHLLKYPRSVIFGATNFVDKLPASNGWIVWDKTGKGKAHSTNGKGQADGELAWSNITGGVRIFAHAWMGFVKESEHNLRVHPTQKPIALFRWILELWGREGEVIVDPYLGSGSSLVACAELGFKAIGIEIVEEYCKVASERVDQAITKRLGNLGAGG